MSFISDFKQFAMKGNIIDMAVGVIVGGAFGKIVSSLVNDIIMPVISIVTGGDGLANFKYVITPGRPADGDLAEIKEVAVNYGVGTFGDSFGWIVNIAPKGFNLFVGMDHTLGKLSKEYIPLGSNAQFSFGINFPL